MQTEMRLIFFIGLLSCAAGLRVVDLTHTLNAQAHRWPTNIPFQLTVVANGTSGTDDEGWYASNDITLSEHTGTHMDAPIHFANRPGIYFASTIPVERLVAPLHVIDLSSEATSNRDYLVTASDITDWENKYEKIREQSVVIFNFGWAQHWSSYEDVFGSTTNDTATFHFPGVGIEAAQLLADRNVYGVGTDTPSVDYGPSQTFPVHNFLLEKNIYFLENVGDMNELPEAGKGVTLIVGAMKIEGGTGGPARLIALVKEEGDEICGSNNSAYALVGSYIFIVTSTLVWWMLNY